MNKSRVITSPENMAATITNNECTFILNYAML